MVVGAEVIWGLIGLGVLLALGGSTRIFARELRRPAGEGPRVEVEVDARARAAALDRRYLGALAVVALLGLVVRLEGVERRGITHTEVYVPGIALPADISEPPPRITLAETLAWHVRAEPHPQAYYWGMWLWTRAFGTSLTALRMPSVLFGVASILLSYWIVARRYGPAAGLLAAALLAFNGHHVFWSQKARMYSMSCFLALLSTGLWLELLKQAVRRPRTELLYTLVTVVGLYTQIYFWCVLAAQLGYSALARDERSGAPRVVFFQALAVILGAPLWAHAIYHSRNEPLGWATAAFTQDFLDFGFLFQPESWSLVARDVPWLPEAVMTGVALAGLVAFARFVRVAPSAGSGDPAEPPAAAALLGPAAGIALVVGVAAALSKHRNGAMAATALLPFLALAGVSWAPALRRRPRLELWSRALEQLPGLRSPLMAVAFGPFALLALISWFRPMLISRGLLVAVPPLLALIAVGLLRLPPSRWLRGALATLLIAGHAGSLAYFYALPNPNDYRGIAEQLKAELAPGDLIFVPPKSWVTTPVFYHLQGEHERIVARDWSEAIARSAGPRVWLLLFSDQKIPGAMAGALRGHQLQRALHAQRARVLLYLPAAPESGVAPARPAG